MLDVSEKIWYFLNFEEVKKWSFEEFLVGYRVRKVFLMFRKVIDGEIIYFIVNYIGRGNLDSVKIFLNKYYK